MPARTVSLAAVLCLAFVSAGCDQIRSFVSSVKKASTPAPAAVTVPPHVNKTVAEYAAPVGGGNMTVESWGVVVGLGKNGSRRVPARLRKYLEEYLAKRKIGSFRAGLGQLTPARVLRDPDTAVVRVYASVPPGAPAGTRFDLEVEMLPQTGAVSLDGGLLMPVDLHYAVGGMDPSMVHTKVWAKGAGTLFLNPFLDPTKPADATKLKRGRVIGGGRMTASRRVRLVLRKPSYQRASLIQQRINERFPSRTKVASAKTPTAVDLQTPRQWRHDYLHFLRLVMHLPLVGGSADVERHALAIGEAMELPTARHEELSLVWEAMGLQAVPFARKLYTSTGPLAAFYSARAGARLGDETALNVIASFARKAGSRLQIPAIEELGRTPKRARALPILRRLIDDPNDLVRVAVYEALRSQRDPTTVTALSVGGEGGFSLELVESARRYVVYATRTGRPRIVLFGREMSVVRPVFFSSLDDMVTINARMNDKKLMIFRKIPATGGVSDPFYVDFQVRSLIETMGAEPVADRGGTIQGLGLTYGQIVAVLARLCRAGDIKAKFVLQTPPEVQRIYRGTVTMGRPDAPVE